MPKNKPLLTDKAIRLARELLQVHRPMTLRQVHYALFVRQATENTEAHYKALSRALVKARKSGFIPWDWIEDRLRMPRAVVMWDDPADFAECVGPQYRRDVWARQPVYVECWLEKDALSGIFADTLDPYGVTLNVGRGFDGWSSIHRASERFAGGGTILYFGDFDPSGQDMVRSLRVRLAELDCEPDIVKCAIGPDDIERYNLPPAPVKKSDTRSKAFVAEYGNVSVELDALPPDVLRERLQAEVEARLDLSALAETQRTEAAERRRLIKVMKQATR